MKTLTLTNEEAYILACVMGYVRYADNTTSLLNKIYDLQETELDVEDFMKVDFSIDISRSGINEITIDVK